MRGNSWGEKHCAETVHAWDVVVLSFLFQAENQWHKRELLGIRWICLWLRRCECDGRRHVRAGSRYVRVARVSRWLIASWHATVTRSVSCVTRCYHACLTTFCLHDRAPIIMFLKCYYAFRFEQNFLTALSLSRNICIGFGYITLAPPPLSLSLSLIKH